MSKALITLIKPRPLVIGLMLALSSRLTPKQTRYAARWPTSKVLP
ncbi:hypothetical protein [Methylobacillus glycogenes]|nr:hypothetical protein [Methylobacillus glycogenes]